MGLQDMRTGSAINACKTCGQTTKVQLQCSANIMDHSPDTTTVPRVTRQHVTTLQTECGIAGRQDRVCSTCHPSHH
jgi:hypothetical protein